MKKKKGFILLVLSIILLASACSGLPSDLDEKPVDGQAYNWDYVLAYSNIKVTFYSSEAPKTFYTLGFSRYYSSIIIKGYFTYTVAPNYIYHNDKISIGGNWTVEEITK